MTPTPRWIRLTPAANIPPLEGRAARIGSLELAVFNLRGRFAAIENRCPHQGGPLCDGIVSGSSVVCPLHGWHFDLNTGMAARASSPACVTIYPVRVEDGIVMIDIASGSRIGEESACVS